MMRGSLRARGIIVTRQRVMDSMGRVDPLSQLLRRRTTTYRREYSVPTPNSLWYVHDIIITREMQGLFGASLRNPVAWPLSFVMTPWLICHADAQSYPVAWSLSRDDSLFTQSRLYCKHSCLCSMV